ncbi:AAA family ATPase [Paenibacillus sp. BSR1-1]|uniref:AAA family ATPase n=1 Tax=Paenibacillus sp. BSR1-1 TaxID=3020845 RepID=UPI0025AFA9F9|nr:AAA family ATPase [Paenibacillus sp. BSR1-1]MDN3015805.1 AAA family ATPase [Paenibacillus sp. BSR1-1]
MNLDTILIKIGHSYREGITADELYHATSVSWKIGERRLQSNEYKYYCAVYNNEIKEVYKLVGYEKDLHPDNEGRFILTGKLADELLRSKLIGLYVGDIHKGSGNPIKYEKMENLLRKAELTSENGEQSDLSDKSPSQFDEMIKHLLYKLAEQFKEIQTLGTNKPNWITKIDHTGVFVETLRSREKYSKGESKYPYYNITFEFLLDAWKEFSANRTASANDFIKTRGRSSFVMAFFTKLPFVESIEKNNIIYIKLMEYTTDQLPEASSEQTVSLLNEIIQENLEPKKISQQYNDDAMKRLKLRARQGLKILGFLTNEYSIQKQIVSGYVSAPNKEKFLAIQIKQSEYLSVIFKLLTFLQGKPKSEKLVFLSEIGMLLVRNSQGQNQMVQSVAEYRTRNILNWFKNTGMVDEEWNVLNEKELHPVKTIEPKDIISHIDKYISSKGFYYEKEEIMNLFLSIKTKPFVIISGISGTGKTMVVKWFAESLGATKENGQFSLIPVRPDWSDGSDLLGYRDIKGEFIDGPLTKVLKQAKENPEKPYFVLLDEMNLARVEYYFSDFLSVMESREWKTGKLVTHSVLPVEIIGEYLGIPENVFIFGTVNMDETTFPFSKKVLDRANTIEFNRVALNNFSFLEERQPVEAINLNSSHIVSRFLHLKEAYDENMDIVRIVSNELMKINSILDKIGAHVGYRVRDEVSFYLIYNNESELLSFNEAFDFQIIQKILPRISGSDYRVFKVLKELYTYCTGVKINDDSLDNLNDGIMEASYPKSAMKLAEMIRRYDIDGFTSFWIGS